MLKVEYGVIGGRGFVALEMENGDREILIEISKTEPKFKATNGCGINVQDILSGKICLPCDEAQFKKVEEAVKQFNSKYFGEFDLEELKIERAELMNRVYELTNENKELKNKIKELELNLTSIKNIIYPIQ